MHTWRGGIGVRHRSSLVQLTQLLLLVLLSSCFGPPLVASSDKHRNGATNITGTNRAGAKTAKSSSVAGVQHDPRTADAAAVFLEVAASVAVDSATAAGGSGSVYINEWAIQLTGGVDAAKRLAFKHGFIYVDQVMDDIYLFKHKKVKKRSTDISLDAAELQNDPEVKWAAQQVAKRRVKRGAVGWEASGGQVTSLFNDEKWPQMWYLNRGGGLDMNILSVWKQGYTGRGVTVTILDDGIEKDHPDLVKNYDADASYDVNEHDNDPQPRYEYSNENKHGTRCAGEVAAEANNSICSVGVAYEARIGGVRMLDGDVTDAVEAQSLSLNPQHIDIYSASWGPDDDGRTVDGPGPLALKAFYEGIHKGRKGLGSIYVWASGNGGRNGDSCNCDGYTNSIYTLSISSATEQGQPPWYLEPCASSLATTYSSGSGLDKQIITTDLRRSCTETHTGTSASAPLAAGLFALVLQANPLLTWRDVQHIVVLTARQANLEANDWITNAAGRKVSHHFGYGLLDVDAMVRAAKNWTTVPAQHRCAITSKQAEKGISVSGKVELLLESHGCDGTKDEVNYLEHVQAVISLTASRRGDIEIFLTSPSGTRSTMLARRVRDMSLEGFNQWAFMTTHSWGENSGGVWKLEVQTGQSSIAVLKSWTLVMYGTALHPLYKSTSRHLRHRPPQPLPHSPVPSAAPSSLHFVHTNELSLVNPAESCKQAAVTAVVAVVAAAVVIKYYLAHSPVVYMALINLTLLAIAHYQSIIL